MGSCCESEYVEFCEENVSFMELGSGNYGAHTIGEDAKLEHLVVMKSLIAGIAIMKPSSLETNALDRHVIPRHEVEKVICSLCGTEQDVQQNCINCGVCMGKYFCEKCKFYDDDTSKNQYHCAECGICRTGGRDNIFHCKTCGCCLSKVMKDAHLCVERAIHRNCPICFEFLFDTMKDIRDV